jgi:6-pyruvoyltetrahydropterin/6-carboxytetrahydropterin synthase
MAHRLPFHDGVCRSLHGHSYRAVIEVEGETDDKGMVIDFQDIKDAADPLVMALDHSCAVDPTDRDTTEFLKTNGHKIFQFHTYSTAENLAAWILEQLKPSLCRSNITGLSVKIFETCTSAAHVTWSRDA